MAKIRLQTRYTLLCYIIQFTASRLEGHIGQEHGALAGNGQGLEVGLAGKVPGIGVIGRADAEGVLLFILNSN